MASHTISSLVAQQGDQRLLAVAVSAVRKAARVCEHVRCGDLLQSASKDDKSPVTVADFAAQAIVNSELATAFPDIPVVGEEDASALRGSDDKASDLRAKVVSAVHHVNDAATEDEILSSIDRGNHTGGSSGRFWALDPIDGTKGFLRNDQYAIALGLVEDGKVIMGVLGCPNLPLGTATDKDGEKQDGTRGSGFVAARGQGAFQFSLTPQSAEEEDTLTRISTSATKTGADARLVESVESGHTSHGLSARVASALGVGRESVRMDSQAKYGALSRGDAEIYLRLPRPGKRYEEKIWDHAAGVVVVEEAGGRVTDVHGKPLDFSQGRTLKENTGVVATNGHLHDATVQELAKAMKEQEAAAN